METDGSVEESLEVYTPKSTDQSLLDQKVRSYLIFFNIFLFFKDFVFYKL